MENHLYNYLKNLGWALFSFTVFKARLIVKIIIHHPLKPVTNIVVKTSGQKENFGLYLLRWKVYVIKCNLKKTNFLLYGSLITYFFFLKTMKGLKIFSMCSEALSVFILSS